MKSKKFIGILSMLFLSCSVFLSACSESEQKKVTVEDDKQQYLNIILDGEPQTLDQSKAVDSYSTQVLAEVNEALTRIEQDGKGKDIVKPAGAEKWDISEDGLKWTFYLRDNQWSDGKKVTAEDYVYGIKRTLDPKVQSQYAFLLYPIKGAKEYNSSKNNIGKKLSSDILGVKALDDRTLEITLESPCSYFLNLTSFKAMQPQRKDLVEKYADKYGTDASTMLYCGPFIIKQWIHNNKVELVKNDNYWDSKSVKLEKVNMKIQKSDSTILNRLKNGSVDIVKVVKPEWKDKIDKSEKLNVVRIPEPATNFQFYNQKNRLFSNDKVRKAFSLAIDREEVSKTLWKGLYTPAYGWVPPSLQIDGEDFREKLNFEPIKKLKDDYPNPKVLLVEGLKELGMYTDPSKVTVNYLQPGTDSDQKEIAEYFQNMYYRNLGVHIKIDYVDYTTYVNRIQSGDYQMSSSVWSADYNDPMTEFDLWVTGVNLINTGWSNKTYDSLIGEVSTLGVDKKEERFQIFKEVETILIEEDAVIAPTVYRNKQIYKHDYVKGVMIPLFGPQLELKYAYTQGR
ncbi:peptide ABC transporter substrate-binding protein [Clostridium sp. DJ247]|uniref:peptide ABC transporter substrate-binding protein n=1 Tax=Clostridium sp. DJ247 TaxID=2726188 RepID=UPI00162340D3|nr:peptide ABC transporter substrate-binding protein [Clostridium sp. DJ247]MBC2580294.1 peptide ABC transporter substrate-binding protein [Clostridium sp. DJ247]